MGSAELNCSVWAGPNYRNNLSNDSWTLMDNCTNIVQWVMVQRAYNECESQNVTLYKKMKCEHITVGFQIYNPNSKAIDQSYKNAKDYMNL